MNAFLMFNTTVESSHVAFSPKMPIPNVAFALGKGASEKASKFECDFVEGGIRYSFGFSIAKGQIAREFLYAFPKGVKQTWYSEQNPNQTAHAFSLGGPLKGETQLSPT